jgi:hypothetical protein
MASWYINEDGSPSKSLNKKNPCNICLRYKDATTRQLMEYFGSYAIPNL